MALTSEERRQMHMKKRIDALLALAALSVAPGLVTFRNQPLLDVEVDDLARQSGLLAEVLHAIREGLAVHGNSGAHPATEDGNSSTVT